MTCGDTGEHIKDPVMDKYMRPEGVQQQKMSMWLEKNSINDNNAIWPVLKGIFKKLLIFQIQNIQKSIWNKNTKYTILNVFEIQTHNYLNVFKIVFKIQFGRRTP